MVGEKKSQKACVFYNSFVEKELGVIADHKVSMNPQCPAVEKKANILLGCINKKIVCQAHEIIFPLCSELSVSQPEELQLYVAP